MPKLTYFTLFGTLLFGVFAVIGQPAWQQLLSEGDSQAAIEWRDLRWGDWSIADGDLSVSATWQSVEGGPVVSINVPVKSLVIANETAEARVGPIDGHLRFHLGFKREIKTDGVQLLELKQIDWGGFVATDIRLQFDLLADRTVRVEALEMNYAGGRVAFEPFVWDPEAQWLDLSMRLEGIDMAVLTQLLPDWGFAAEGQMDGGLVMRISPGQLDLQPSLLRYRTGTDGRIRYDRVGWLTQGRGADAQSRALRAAEEAFGNLAIEDMELQIRGFDVEGPQAVLKVAGEGKSQELNTQVPVRLQINLAFSRADIESLPLFQFLREGLFFE